MKKIKVLCNGCYGGFGLSTEAEQLLIKKKRWKQTDNSVPYTKSLEYKIRKIPRHDPHLIAVVEELGAKANGDFAKLEIEEIEGDRYRIEEYDGLENVVEPDDQEWIVVKTKSLLDESR